MNRNSPRKKHSNNGTVTVKADVTGYKKVPKTMGFLKSNIVGGLLGFLTAAIMWVITLPIMVAGYYMTISTHISRAVYRIAVRLTLLLEKSGLIKSLSYEQAVTVKNISSVIFLLEILLALAALTVLHEFVHKWVWQFGFDKQTRKNEFKIGITKLTPYCHCKVDLSLRKMIYGTIAPTIVTGCLIMLIGAFAYNPLIVIIGAFGVAAGGSDQLQVLMLLPYWKQSKRKKIICGDLEDEFGCVLYIEPDK